MKHLKSTPVRRRGSWLQSGVGGHDHRERKEEHRGTAIAIREGKPAAHLGEDRLEQSDDREQ